MTPGLEKIFHEDRVSRLQGTDEERPSLPVIGKTRCHRNTMKSHDRHAMAPQTFHFPFRVAHFVDAEEGRRVHIISFFVGRQSLAASCLRLLTTDYFPSLGQ